jgi:DNA-binding Lrp family transcriptional regulator
VDRIDQQIVASLMRDSRATYAEIGEEVNLSPPAVKRRIDRLVDDRVIRGFTAVVDPATTGWRTEAFVEVFCSGAISPESLRRAWAGIPEVVGAWTITGQPDALLRVVATDVGHLEEVLERIRSAASIDHTETAILLSTLIDRHVPAPD